MFLALLQHCLHTKITCNSITRPKSYNHVINKIKIPQEASCIPNSTLQQISDQRIRSELDKQVVAHLLLIQNAQSAIKGIGQRM